MIISCVLKTGGDYHLDYVYKLYGGVRRFARSYFEFVCLTDFPDSEISERYKRVIRWESLTQGWPGWWSKLELFRPDVFPKNQSVFYLDLDTILVGDCREIFSREFLFSGPEDWYGNRVKGMTTSLLSWKTEESILELFFDAQKFIQKHINERNWKKHWDQVFIESALSQRKVPTVYLDQEFPGQILSYKRDCKEGIPKNAKIICFHGKPRPHQLSPEDPLIRDFWKV